MGEVPAGVDPSQQEQARDIGNTHQERLEADLGGDSAVPAWAGVGHAETGDTQSSGSTHMGGTRPTSAMRYQGYAPAETASGVCSQDNTPSEPAQQDRSPSAEPSPASLQAASAKPNVESMESMESMAIDTIMKMDDAMDLEQMALCWQKRLANRDTYPNSSGRHAEEAMPRSLSRHLEARDRADGGK